MRKIMLAALCGIPLTLGACATTRPAAPVRYVDAHSHVATSITTDEEVMRLWQAGIDRVLIMDPDPATLARIAARNADFIVPFISAARTRQMVGLRYEPGLADRYAALYRSGAVCGFGELPTRTEPNPHPDDATAISTPLREEVYALANSLGVPVTLHVSLERPETIAAVARIARQYPRMKLILAHAGWGADASVIAGLMAGNPNVHADLSVRLDPVQGLPSGAVPQPPNISILDSAGHLQPAWRAVIMRFPDRFLFALDISADERPAHIERLVATARTALSALPPRVHAAVAGGNIERLLQGCALRIGSVAQEPPRGFDGTVEEAGADFVRLRLADGTLTRVEMKPGWAVVKPVPQSLASIRAGDFIGSMNRTGPDAETARAAEVRRFEEGYRPEAGTHAMAQPGQWMTHGRVAAVQEDAQGRVLVIDQPGGQRRLRLAPDLPVLAYEAKDPSVLRNAPRVSAVTRRDADGVWRAGRLVLSDNR